MKTARWLVALAAATALAPGAGTAQAYVDDKPAAVEFNGKAYVAMNRGGRIHLNSWSGRWSGWQDPDGWLDSGPSLSTRPGTLDMFAKNGTTVFHRYTSDGSSWSGWGALDGCARSAPSSTTRYSAGGQVTSLDVVVRDCNNNVGFKLWSPGGGWTSGYIPLDPSFTTTKAPSIVSLATGELAIYATRASDGTLHQNYWNGSGWSGWIQVIGGALSTSPTVINEGGRPTIYARNSVGDVVQTSWLGSNWMPWANLGRRGGTDGIGAMKASNGNVSVYVHEGSDAYGSSYVQGSGWTGWGLLDSPLIFSSPTNCQRAAVAPGSTLGVALGLEVNAVASNDAYRRDILDQVGACMVGVTGRGIDLRMQLPIDAMRAGRDGATRIRNFKSLLSRTGGATGVISIMSPDFGAGCTTTVERVTTKDDGVTPLGRCRIENNAYVPGEYPSPAVYNSMFAAIAREVGADSRIVFTAWNEPEHGKLFYLTKATSNFRTAGAAVTDVRTNALFRAGQYWTEAAKIVGASKVLAGEFTESSTSSAYKAAFLDGVERGRSASSTKPGLPTQWAKHPYADMTAGATSAFSQTMNFQQLIFGTSVPSTPLWLTEVGNRVESGTVTADQSRAAGSALRQRLEASTGTNKAVPVRAFVYHLSALDRATDAGKVTYDSALVDANGRARPVLCGLGGVDISRCGGATK